MKNFYIKYKNPIGVAIDIIIILLGILSKTIVFSIMGIVLLFLTLYVAKIEKQNAEKEAQRVAEKQAFKAEQKRLNKGKKKTKKRK